MTEPQQLRERADQVLELHERGDFDAALAAAEQLAADASLADTDDEVVRESLFTARFERALLLTELGDLITAAEAYAEAAETPTDLGDADQRHEVAMALLNRGICLDSIGDPAAAIAAYDDLVERFAGADDPVTADQVIRARVNRAATLLTVERAEEALSAALELLGSLDAHDSATAEQRAMTIRIQGAALLELDRMAEAAEALAAVADCSDEGPEARAQIAVGHREHAQTLMRLGRPMDAAASLDAVLTRFAEEEEPEVRGVLEDLRYLRSTLPPTA